MSVHELVRRYLEQCNYEIEEVAVTSGIPCQELKQVLYGELVMYPEHLRAICYALRISANTFISYG